MKLDGSLYGFLGATNPVGGSTVVHAPRNLWVGSNCVHSPLLVAGEWLYSQLLVLLRCRWGVPTGCLEQCRPWATLSAGSSGAFLIPVISRILPDMGLVNKVSGTAIIVAQCRSGSGEPPKGQLSLSNFYWPEAGLGLAVPLSLPTPTLYRCRTPASMGRVNVFLWNFSLISVFCGQSY